MKHRPSAVGLVRLLALGLTIALLIPVPCALAQGTQGPEKQQAEVVPLLDEILSVTQSGGEEGLREWMKANKDRVGNELITALADYGRRARDERLLGASLVLAGEKGDETTLGAVYLAAGIFYYQIGNNSQAMTFYEKALLIERAVGNRPVEATTLNDIGLVYSDLGEKAKALEYYQQALSIVQTVGNRAGEGRTLNNIGLVYSDLGEKGKALEYCQQALPIVQAVGDRAGEALTLNNIGLVYSDFGEKRKALEYYQQALPIERTLDDRTGEAATLHNIGGVYWALGEQAKALEYFEQALPIEQALGDRLGEAQTLNNIGAVYRDLGEKAKALEYYQQALSIVRAVGDRLGEAPTLSNIGLVHADLGENRKALECYQQALLVERTLGDHKGEAVTLSNIGLVYSDLGEKAKALEYLQQALAIERAMGDRAGEATTLNNIGLVYSDLGEKAKALEYLQQTLPIERAVGDRAHEAGTLNNLMSLHQESGHSRLAIFFGKQSVNLYQELRANIQGLPKETQKTYLKNVERTYRTLANILIAQGRLPEALQVLDLLKQEEYLTFVKRDAGEASSLSARAALTPAEAEWARRFAAVADPVADLGRKRSELEAKKVRRPEEEAELAKVNADLEVALKAFQEFADRLATEFGKPEAGGTPVLQVREAQDLMQDLRELGAGTVALYTLVGEKSTRVVLVTPDTLKAGESTITGADLEAKVKAFRVALQHRALDPRPAAQELYRIMVGPIAKDLEQAGAQTLMWSLDGILRYVPVAALHDGIGYMIERYRSVVFTPASNARLKESPSRAWRGVGLGVSRATEGFSALPGVPFELRGIFRDERSSAGVIPGTVLLDEAFTAAAMNAAIAKGIPVVHVASHFQFVPGNETASFLLLGDKEKTKNHLTLDQIRTSNNLFGGVELLTLSACETALGGEANGTEVEGLAVLAQRQGAKSVIATLWPVADASTSLLMRELYRLREATPGTPKIEALRQAQLALLQGHITLTSEEAAARGPRPLEPEEGGGERPGGLPPFTFDPNAPYAHPYFWAPFILFGNWR